MDREVADKMQRVAGQLEALNAFANAVYCMPGDAATVAIVVALRGLSDHAVRSAQRYAEEYAKASI
jgi:hypothetical protein